MDNYLKHANGPVLRTQYKEINKKLAMSIAQGEAIICVLKAITAIIVVAGIVGMACGYLEVLKG